MKSVKLFEQYILESQGSQFSHAVLTALEPTILDMVDRIKVSIIAEYAKKDIKYEINQWEEECIRIGLIVDMLKSFEKYTEPTDKLVKIQPRNGSKGIEIWATIARDGQDYDYYTEAIGAGGYNIQSYHFRYLTKTKLPNSKIKGTLANEYAEKLKRMTKAEKLNNDIKNWEDRIEKASQHIQQSLGFTDEEILAKYYAGDNSSGKPYKWPTWKEIVKNGSAKNFNNDEASFNQEKAKSEANSIEFWKSKNIKWKQQDIANGEKELKKLRAKLEAIVNQ